MEELLEFFIESLKKYWHIILISGAAVFGWCVTYFHKGIQIRHLKLQIEELEEKRRISDSRIHRPTASEVGIYGKKAAYQVILKSFIITILLGTTIASLLGYKSTKNELSRNTLKVESLQNQNSQYAREISILENNIDQYKSEIISVTATAEQYRNEIALLQKISDKHEFELLQQQVEKYRKEIDSLKSYNSELRIIIEREKESSKRLEKKIEILNELLKKLKHDIGEIESQLRE